MWNYARIYSVYQDRSRGDLILQACVASHSKMWPKAPNCWCKTRAVLVDTQALVIGGFAFMIGIYAIYNTATGKIYVGSSRNIQLRWAQHRSCLKHNKSTPHLQRAWNKYGEASFEFIVLEECSVENLIEREQFWYDSLAPAYNCGRPKPGAPEVSSETREKIRRSLRGRKFPRSPEHQKKLTAALRGRKLSPETRSKLSEMRRGKKRKPHSAETRHKISIANLGRYVPSRPCKPETREKIRIGLMGNKNGLGAMISTETREKISTALKGRAKSDTHKQNLSASHRGKTLSAETRKKVSEKLKGKKKSPEAIEKFRIARMGHPVSEETRAKLSAAKKGKTNANRGRKHSPEFCQRMSEARKGRTTPPEVREKMRVSAIESWKRRKAADLARKETTLEASEQR